MNGTAYVWGRHWEWQQLNAFSGQLLFFAAKQQLCSWQWMWTESTWISCPPTPAHPLTAAAFSPGHVQGYKSNDERPSQDKRFLSSRILLIRCKVLLNPLNPYTWRWLSGKLNWENTIKSTDNSKLMNLAGTFHTRVYELKKDMWKKDKQQQKKVQASGAGGDRELVFFT